MSDPRHPPSRPVARGFKGLAELFPHQLEGSTAPPQALVQRVEPPTRAPLAKSAYVAPRPYLSPSAFQVPTGFAAGMTRGEPHPPTASPSPAAEPEIAVLGPAPLPSLAPSQAPPPEAPLMPPEPVVVTAPPAPASPQAMPFAAEAPITAHSSSHPPAASAPRLEPTWQAGVNADASASDAPSTLAPPADALADSPLPALSPLAASVHTPSEPPPFRPYQGSPVWVWLVGGVVLVGVVAVALVKGFAHFDRPRVFPALPARVAASSPPPPPSPVPAPAPAPSPSEPPPAAAPAPAPVPATVATVEAPLPVPVPAPMPTKPADLPAESKPPVGEGNLLALSQIRYCVAQNMRLSAQNKMVRSDSSQEVGHYNDLLGDYNLRCRNFKYERGELQRVLTLLEADRPQIEARAKSDWLAQRDEVIDDVKVVRPPAGAAPPRPRRVEPAERPLWWCLPGPENKCVPM